jgi:hypothetical protein
MVYGGGLGGSFAERSKVWLVDVVAKDGQDLEGPVTKVR